MKTMRQRQGRGSETIAATISEMMMLMKSRYPPQPLVVMEVEMVVIVEVVVVVALVEVV